MPCLGRNVIIEQSYGGPKITKGTYSVYFYSLIFLNISLDGVTVAKPITLEDKFENLGARYVLTFLHISHTNHTQLLVLSKMSLKKRTKWLEMVLQLAAGCNPMDLRRGSQAAVDNVVQYLSAQTKTITTTAEIAQVATISANGDPHVGNLIAQAMENSARKALLP